MPRFFCDQINDLKNNYSLVYGETHQDTRTIAFGWRHSALACRSLALLSVTTHPHVSACPRRADMMIKNMDKVVKAHDTDNYRNMY